MADSFEVTAHLPAKPEEVYRAWLDGAEHSAFTGGKAEVEPTGGRALHRLGRLHRGPHPGAGAALRRTGYRGARLRILQAWRTTEFPEGSPDSRLEVLLEKSRGGTRITLRHSDIPAGQGAEYQQGWEEHYFTPLKRYFAGKKGA